MNLNDIKLSKEDTDAIIKELNEEKKIHEQSQEYQDFIRDCLRIAREWK